MTAEQETKAAELAQVIATIAAGAVGGPGVAVALSAIASIAPVVVTLISGKDPSPDELATADAVRIASNTRMNAATEDALTRADA